MRHRSWVKKSVLGALTLLVCAAQPLLAETLASFKSDGCSAFPNGNLENQKAWLRCCVVHDHAYWQGGTYQQRLDADEALEQCVENVGEPELALLMLAGVRVGGSPFLPTTFRWGFGWEQARFYAPLDEQEQRAVMAHGEAAVAIEKEWQRISAAREWYEQF